MENFIILLPHSEFSKFLPPDPVRLSGRIKTKIRFYIHFFIEKVINKYLASQIKSNFPFNPTAEQENCLENISEFILSADDRKVFMLCGYAGTGKTTLISALVKTMSQLERRCVLLAPTGRAAKVFSSYSGKSAYTIHKWIYRQKSILNGSPFVLMENRAVNTMFIVDEASMIANEGGSVFGTGALLDDLIEFVYSGQGCFLLLLGDTAQLPPVGEELSPALSEEYLRSLFLDVTRVELTHVMRQLDGSGVLQNATMLRDIIRSGECGFVPKVKLKGFADICVVTGEELIEAIEGSYSSVGVEVLKKPRFEYNKNITSSSKPFLGGVTGGVCKEHGRIHRAIVIRDYYAFQLHENELQSSIRTTTKFRGLPPPFGVGTHCLSHCSPRVAQRIRGIRTYRRPLLPPIYHRRSP